MLRRPAGDVYKRLIHYMLGRLAGPGGIGWEPFKAAFRELTTTGGAPSGKYDKFEYLLSLLSKHATRLTRCV